MRFTLLILAAVIFSGCKKEKITVATEPKEDPKLVFDTPGKNTDPHGHGHSHSHRHGKPLHGGRIVSIGHTHHKNGATHFHAEVMPLTGDIRFHDGIYARDPVDERDFD